MLPETAFKQHIIITYSKHLTITQYLVKTIANSLNLSVAALFLFLSSGCGNNDQKKNAVSPSAAQQALNVEVLIAEPTTILDNVEASGSLLPFETTELHPEVSGRITGLYFKEGSYVSAGTLLVKLYDADLKAQLGKQHAQLATAQKTVERYGQLLKINGISQQEYDLAVLAVNNIKADIELLQTNIAKTELKAPFSGKLGLKNVSIGAFITPSTVITTIAEVNQLKLQFSVPEKYAAQIHNGEQVHFSIDGSRKSFTASVIATEVSIAEDTRNLSVRAVVKANDPVLVPGAFAKVKIELGKNSHALLIPTNSVLLQGRKKLIYIYKAGKAVSTEITTGVRDASNIEVVSGLHTGDTVICTGLLFLKPNSNVKISRIN
jgi:membrane fusion protein (multidrug efflux system)